MDGPSDQELVLRAVALDDRHAFTTLVRRHQSAVRAFARRLWSGDTARADDTAQDAFLQAHRHLAQFRGEGSFVSWLLALTYRAFLTDKRRAHHQRERSTDDDIASQAGAPAVDPTRRADVERALGALKVEERAALTLCFDKDLSHEEAAAILGMPLGTLKSHVARGKEKLKVALAAYRPPTTASTTSTTQEVA